MLKSVNMDDVFHKFFEDWLWGAILAVSDSALVPAGIGGQLWWQDRDLIWHLPLGIRLLSHWLYEILKIDRTC